jgi:DNA processing protein
VAASLKAGPDPGQLAHSLSWLHSPRHHLLCLGDARYPSLLLECGDPPLVLYVEGRLELLTQPAVAVVGSRSPTRAGALDAEAISEALSNAGLTIVSGLALGIDAAAHRGGLLGKRGSIAVLGTGVDCVYPARNRQVAERLCERGAMISELPLGAPPLAHHFPRRNRIISGLCKGCLVVEATMRSGSLITARMAAEQGREVFALPGSIHSPQSKGCHWLIRQGATLVESAVDVLRELGMDERLAAPIPGRASPLPPASGWLLDAVDFSPTDLDTICERSNLTPDSASAMLLLLELEGYIARVPGGFFQRLQ